MDPFYGWGATVSRLESQWGGILPLSCQILIWWTPEEWKADLTWEPPSGFELGPIGLKSSALSTKPAKLSPLAKSLFTVNNKCNYGQNHATMAGTNKIVKFLASSSCMENKIKLLNIKYSKFQPQYSHFALHFLNVDT